MNDEVMVSVLCATYNQKSYIRHSLDSLLMQETDFCYEILVHDDASTDGTTEIIREYANAYPNKVHAFIEKENKFSKNIDYWKDWLKDYPVGKYFAYCEGDDYWTDPHKLQKQFDAMEAHPKCDMCACRAVLVTEDENTEIGEIRPAKQDRILTMEETILGGGMFLATNSLFWRRNMSEPLMKFEQIRSLDYATQMRGALRGGIYYLDECMVAYRRFAKGSWTTVLTASKEMSKLQCEQEKLILCTLDEETQGRFHDAITERLKAYDTSFYDQLVDNREELLQIISACVGRLFMWGIGRRGMAFEEFCTKEGIKLTGVCDVTNNCVGLKTAFGNDIYHSDEVIEKADAILASTTRAYDYLRGTGYDGKLYDLQKYMMIA